mgnify:CR=1 FL=1
MKNLVICLFLGLLAVMPSLAQSDMVGDKLAIGLQLTQHQNDFGLGLNLSSPYFANKKMTIRLRGNMVWNQHASGPNETTWSPYSNFSFGLATISGNLGDQIRVYGEGGAIALFPSTQFSNESVHFGGYGLFGFEFFMYKHDNYFIEIGGVGTGATANKIPGSPIYSNGMVVNVGYRHQF